ncbi:MAG TPA: DUF3000 domain-containing protein [Streptosporangiaceae bacterium]|nr:DUF3000 domain-containing protein [Streptosporangiaceae bacterium]
MTSQSTVPAPFQRALEALRRALDGDPGRPELVIEDMPAPQRLAPYSAAISASVSRGDDVDVAVGRLIVLYDPQGRSGWPSDFRIVAYVSADLEPEIAADPLVGSVAWSWLIEALEPIGYAGVSGTITRAVSESFGDKADDPATTELELRASWSPQGGTAAGGPPRGVARSARSARGAGGTQADQGRGHETDDIDIDGHIAAWCEVLCQAAGLPPSGVTAIPPRPASSG